MDYARVLLASKGLEGKLHQVAHETPVVTAINYQLTTFKFRPIDSIATESAEPDRRRHRDMVSMRHTSP